MRYHRCKSVCISFRKSNNLRQSTRLHCEFLLVVPDGAEDLLQDTVNVTLLSHGATGQPLHSSPLFWADKWFSLLLLIRAFLSIHQLSVPGFTQKCQQKQRLWHTEQKYQQNLLTQTMRILLWARPFCLILSSSSSPLHQLRQCFSREREEKPGSSFL